MRERERERRTPTSTPDMVFSAESRLRTVDLRQLDAFLKCHCRAIYQKENNPRVFAKELGISLSGYGPCKVHRLDGKYSAGSIPEISPRDSRPARQLLLFLPGAGSGCRWRCREHGFFRDFQMEAMAVLAQPAGQPILRPELELPLAVR